MRLLSSNQARYLDRITVDKFKISNRNLMKNAGKEIAFYAKKMVNNIPNPVILVICGKGNNGGDGYAAASFLQHDGFNVSVQSIVAKELIKREALFFYEECVNLGIPISFYPSLKSTNDFHLIIDGLLGIGLKGPIENNFIKIFTWLNNLNSKILSIDVPSGLNCDNGTFRKSSVKADCTVTFGAPKIGMYLRHGPQYCGKIVVGDIGFPSLNNIDIPGPIWKINNVEMLDKYLKKPSIDINKNSAGKVLIIAGSQGMTGAAILSTYAALRSGAGLTLTTAPKSLSQIYEQSIIEGMTLTLNDQNSGRLGLEHFESIMDRVKWADSVLLGPGLGRDLSTQKLIRKLVKYIDKPLILDADGLFPFSNDIFTLSKRVHPLIITPHFGEFANILDYKVENIITEFPDHLDFLLNNFNHVCLVKQIPICTAYGNSVRINITGNCGLATAGTGDVLAGIIASFVAQGFSYYNSAFLGAHIHGMASDYLLDKKGYRGQIASDLLESIPEVLKLYEKS